MIRNIPIVTLLAREHALNICKVFLGLCYYYKALAKMIGRLLQSFARV